MFTCTVPEQYSYPQTRGSVRSFPFGCLLFLLYTWWRREELQRAGAAGAVPRTWQRGGSHGRDQRRRRNLNKRKNRRR